MRVASAQHLLAALLLVSVPCQLDAKFDSFTVTGRDHGFVAKAVDAGSRQGHAILLPDVQDMHLVRVSPGTAMRSADGDTFHPPSIGQYLVRVEAPVRKKLAKELRQLAQGNVRYVPHHTFLVDIPDSALSAVMEVDGVTEVFVYPSALKIDISLKAEAKAELSRRRSAVSSTEANADQSKKVKISVRLMAGRADNDAVQMAPQWEASLKLHDSGLRTVVETANVINVHTTKDHLGEVAEWIAAQDLVDRVVWNREGQLQDYYTDQAMQAGRQGWTGTPIWDKGISGQGQIITVSDTGIDAEHCVFYDSTETPAKCSGTVGYVPTCFNPNHRKILSIHLPTQSVGTGFFDYGKGHGTQCASLAAGVKRGANNDHFLTGVAPGAKLIIEDLSHEDGPANPGDPPAALQFPGDWTTWFGHSYQGGSRIHSCSWINSHPSTGGDNYQSTTRDADEFVYNNPDYVLVFAAGNFGESGYFSVQEPSTGKNVLSVGMTKNARSAYNERCQWCYPAADGNCGPNTCGHSGHFLKVDSDDWDALADEAIDNTRQIEDWRWWKEEHTGQFFSFYDWFRQDFDSADCQGDYELCNTAPLAKNIEDYLREDTTTWYKNLNTIEVKPLTEDDPPWGGSLGDNEVLATKLVAPTDHPCGCDLEAGTYTNGEVLILHWDWNGDEGDAIGGVVTESRVGRGMCNPFKPMYKLMHDRHPDWFQHAADIDFESAGYSAGYLVDGAAFCDMDTAWARIKDSGASGVILIGNVDTDFGTITGRTNLMKPPTADLTGPPVYEVQNKFGQILFAAVAKEFFLKRLAWYQLTPDFNAIAAEAEAALENAYPGYWAPPADIYYFYMDLGDTGKFDKNYWPDFTYAGTWGNDYLDIELESIEHNIARSTGSRGPTRDLRFKPDILCAGETPLSAASDDTDTGSGSGAEHCPVSYDDVNAWDHMMATSGTSMATPNCAGGAALIRQYFVEGWHVAGTKNEAQTHNPSAALIKAMVINSGQPVRVEGSVPNSPRAYKRQLEGYPNYLAGFGFFSIGHVLMFDDSDFTLVVEDRFNTPGDPLSMGDPLATGEFYETCLTVNSVDQPLVVSLAWTDSPGVTSAGRVLVNNLDLVVISPNGVFYYGNHLTHSEYGSVPDYLNNMERVKIEAPVAGAWTVRVIGTDIPDGPQGFALVGTGVLTASDVSVCAALLLNECENGCSQNGVCVNGHCECAVPYAGSSCDVQIIELVDGTASSQVTVQPVRTTYFWLDLTGVDSADLDVTVTVVSGEVDVQMTDCGYPGMADVKESQFLVDASAPATLSTTGTCGKWVIAVTGHTDPRILTRDAENFAAPESTAGSVVTVQAASSNTAGTGTSCVVPPAGCGSATPSTDPLDLSNLPNTNYPTCTQPLSWPEITALEVSDPSKVKTGGLGSRMQEDKYEVWICLVDNACSEANDPMCFVYDEAEQTFKAWGKNSDLNIF